MSYAPSSHPLKPADAVDITNWVQRLPSDPRIAAAPISGKYEKNLSTGVSPAAIVPRYVFLLRGAVASRQAQPQLGAVHHELA
jgi:hypothetical protein